MNRRSSRRRGMTLIEVLVAITILLVMSAVIFESLRNSIEFHNLLSSRDETVRTARATMAKITRDIQLAYLTPNQTALNSYQTVFVGDDNEPSRLFFASLNHQRLYLNSRECDQTEITIWAEEAPEGRGSGYILFHREAPRIDQYPDEQGVIWPLAYNVRTFRVRYLDQQSGEWRDEWDTRSADTPYRLPRAVEIGLVLIAPDPEDPTGERTIDVPFLSTAVLEYAQRMPSTNPTMAGGASTVGGGGIPGMGGVPGGAGSPSMASQMGAGMMGAGPLAPGQGGYGGMGAGGLSGGNLGGTLGMLPGAKPRGGSGRAPSRAPTGGAPGTGSPR